jgi:hypothetical protein
VGGRSRRAHSGRADHILRAPIVYYGIDRIHVKKRDGLKLPPIDVHQVARISFAMNI